MRYTAPFFNSNISFTNAFNCPRCGAFAEQQWRQLSLGGHGSQTDIYMSICRYCHQYCLWHEKSIIFPDVLPVPLPNEDLNDDIKIDYREAASILAKSPRGAAALLRLCIQKLCQQLGQPGQNINDDIAALVKEGLPIQVQQAMDIVRLIGNDAVHPGQLDLRDDTETANELFALVNFVAETRITQPNKLAALYESLPESKRAAIEKRDAVSDT